jgi:hypothetical protein
MVAAEMIMAHLSNYIFMSHARQKRERYMVGIIHRRRTGSVPTTLSGEWEIRSRWSNTFEAELERTETQSST